MLSRAAASALAGLRHGLRRPRAPTHCPCLWKQQQQQTILVRGMANNLPLSDPWKLLNITRSADLDEIKQVRAA